MPLKLGPRSPLPRGPAHPIWGAMARLWTLIALVALVLMPIGMAAAPAMAEPAQADHCDDHQQPAEVPASTALHCSGCALAPLDADAEVAPLSPEAQPQPPLAEAFSGIEPATDPPPPKRS